MVYHFVVKLGGAVAQPLTPAQCLGFLLEVAQGLVGGIAFAGKAFSDFLEGSLFGSDFGNGHKRAILKED